MSDFTCPDCGQTFIQLEGLTAHRRSILHDTATDYVRIECKAGFEEHDLRELHDAGAFAVYEIDPDGLARFLHDFATYREAYEYGLAHDPKVFELQTATYFADPAPLPPPDLGDIAEVEEWLNS